MQADWSVACGADDPIVVVPWAAEDGSTRYLNLRDAPTGIDEIPEAVQYPSLATAFRRWNRQDSPLFTAKCDVWNYAAELFDAEDLAGFAFAQGSYIDLIQRKAEIFSSFAVSERMLRRWTECAQSIALAEGRCEWTLRPARILPAGTEVNQRALGDKYTDGFATTLYVWGYGSSLQIAATAWSAALAALIEPIALFKEASL